jgi:hypothetical protein
VQEVKVNPYADEVCFVIEKKNWTKALIE